MQDLLVIKRTPLGLLTHVKGSPILFSQVVERLQNLAAARETKEAKAEVYAVLACPWWGLRVAAIKTVAAWGGAANKAWLVERALRASPDIAPRSKEHRWWAVETSAAMCAVVSSLDNADAAWALTLAYEDVRAQVALYGYVERVPDHLFLSWLQRPLRESRGLLRVRLVNTVGRRKTLPGYMALMRTFADDECEQVAAAAQRYIAEEGSRQEERPAHGQRTGLWHSAEGDFGNDTCAKHRTGGA